MRKWSGVAPQIGMPHRVGCPIDMEYKGSIKGCILTDCYLNPNKKGKLKEINVQYVVECPIEWDGPTECDAP